MSSYDLLAEHYDLLTRDINYEVWADYYADVFKRFSNGVHNVLDLACGTGSLSWCLSRRGYDVVGVDSSEAMLSKAVSKDGGGNPPMFICQDMRELDLYGTVDAAICMLDGINYVTVPENLLIVFERVRLFLEPGGIFIFDVNTPYKLSLLDGEYFVDDTDDVYCAWRVDFEKEKHLASYSFDIFEKVGKLWRRGEEKHMEYVYEPEELKYMLKKVGFNDINIFGNMSMLPPEENEMRIFICAVKGK